MDRPACFAVSYSYVGRVHGTDYVYPPPGLEGDPEAFAAHLAARFPGLRVVSVRAAPVRRGTADGGHPVRESFDVPSFFLR